MLKSGSVEVWDYKERQTEAPPAGAWNINSFEEDNFTYYSYYAKETKTGQGIIPHGSTVNVSGHSLGGHLAGALAVVTGLDALVYNAPSVDWDVAA
jgi:putative lipase involved disintegration of autophagic bodies